jgi:hypothetical protein
LNAGLANEAGDVMDVVFEVTNLGPKTASSVSIEVTVTSEDVGALREATVLPPGESEPRPCPIGGNGNTATCEVRDQAAEGVATVSVHVSSLTKFHVDVNALSPTTDKRGGNNHDGFGFEPPSPAQGPS